MTSRSSTERIQINNMIFFCRLFMVLLDCCYTVLLIQVLPPIVCGKQESKQCLDRSENVGFEWLNASGYGLKQNTELDKNVLWFLEMIRSISILINFKFWLYNVVELLEGLHHRSQKQSYAATTRIELYKYYNINNSGAALPLSATVQKQFKQNEQTWKCGTGFQCPTAQQYFSEMMLFHHNRLKYG